VIVIRFDAGHFWIKTGGRWHRLPFIIGPALVSCTVAGFYMLITEGPRWLALAGWLVLLVPYFVLFTLLIWRGARYHIEKRGL
jgi:hypothetical protein